MQHDHVGLSSRVGLSLQSDGSIPTLCPVLAILAVLEQKCQYEEAEFMHHRALEGREKALGPEHHVTLASKQRITLTPGQQKSTVPARMFLEITLFSDPSSLLPLCPHVLTWTRLNGKIKPHKNSISHPGSSSIWKEIGTVFLLCFYLELTRVKPAGQLIVLTIYHFDATKCPCLDRCS
ncbi:hypothetical protein N7451_003782 [Penicillium sp. IBT 35674x]|nr:hypothetical protein N7451_003782 [Penicillium sp. IBT 35674x]